MSKITNDGFTGLAQDAFYLYPCGNSGRQKVHCTLLEEIVVNFIIDVGIDGFSYA